MPPTIGCYFISGARKSYNIAKTLSLAGCRVLVRLEPSQAELLANLHDPSRADEKYCSWLYSDPAIEIVEDATNAPPVDGLLYEICRRPPRFPEELRAWIRRAPRTSAWNSSWHESTTLNNLRSELRIVANFVRFLPHTQSVVMHNGRISWRPTALFSRAFIQGAFVHPLYLCDPALRTEMFGVPWESTSPRPVRLIFSGDAASPRRRALVEQVRQFIERQNNVSILSSHEEILSNSFTASKAVKLILWIASFDPWKNHIPWDAWPAVLRNCDFCFCPPGYEHKSHRVIECMLQGAIPILHCPEDYDIEMVDGVNCIIVRNGDWEAGVARAMKYEFSDIVKMRKGVAALVTKHLGHPGSARRWLGFMGLEGAR